VLESDGVVLADGGRAREGQRSLDDARWSPNQQRLDDLDGEDDDVDRGDGIETDGGTEIEPLADRLNTIAIDSGKYADAEKMTKVDTALLQRATSIIDELGWREVDIRLVEPEDDWAVDNPAVLLSPPRLNTGILLAPMIEDDEEVSDDE